MNRIEMLKRLDEGENPLEISIQKWQDIENEKGTNSGSYNCALCETARDECLNCIIQIKTGFNCRKTPYDMYDRFPTKENARKEKEFLMSLR